MAKLRILVAEDNLVHASKMEMILDELGYDLIGIFNNEAEVMRMFNATLPDLVILDIDLKDSDDGVSIASKINNIRPTPIIFATSFVDKETISRALQTDPYAYLIKPIEKPSLQAAIELAVFKLGKKDQEGSAGKFSGWSEDLVLNESFFIKSGSKLVKVAWADIRWIEVSQDRYCEIVSEKRSFQIRSSMNQLEEKLNPAVFVRIHRSHIVNIEKVDGVDDVDMVVEVGEKSLPLGGAYKNNLMNRLRLL